VKAVIMAGGFGTRLRPLTINVPKPMVPIGNLPMMEHVISLLKTHNITDITSLLFFQPDQITNYFKDGSDFGVRMSYCRPDEDFGTAGAVRFALELATETTLIISGDLITDFDLTAAIDWHKSRKSDATLVLTRTENPLSYGIVITDDSGQIVRFLEKPTWGEAFSDTINTGIYILEPSAISLIPKEQNFDFSQNLFPLMLSKRMRLFGKIIDGYWKDVGNVAEYHRVHQDIFSNGLELDFKLPEGGNSGSRLFKESESSLPSDVIISGTVILGREVKVESGTKLHNCVLGDRSSVGRNCDLNNSIIWADTVIGNHTSFNSVIVGHRVRVGDNVQLHDNAIIGDDCYIGNSATVRADCKVWPSKTVEDGAIVSRSMVWGEKWNRELITDSKVTGLALTELSPEMTVRLGSAFGAIFGPGAEIVTSRDSSDISRLLRRGLISGLLASGVNVADLESMPVPVMRFCLGKGKYAAGLYVRHNPEDYRQVDFIFFDGSGLDMPPSKLKKIERNYFGEDYERASLDTIGHLDTPQRVLDDYRHEFISEVDVDTIRKAGYKVVIDHSNGSSSQIFPTLFSQLGIDTTELNAALNPRKFSTSVENRAQATRQLSAIVTSLKADVGFMLNPAAEKLTVIDELGQPIDGQLLLLMVTELYLQLNRPKRIAVPVGASMGIEEIAHERGVEVIRVANDHRAMMEVRLKGMADFVGGTRGGFIFPGFQMGADAILATVRIIEMMARTNTRLSSLRKQFDDLSRQSASVPCPWSKRGMVMRRLITDSTEKQRQLIDGVRVFEDNGWVLVTPDRFNAAFTIMAESRSENDAYSLVNRYKSFVEESLKA